MVDPFILVLGGARSGKSRYAERLASAAGRPVTYIATAGPPRDAEMAERIASHQARRPAAWRLVEEPVALAETLGAMEGLALVDCLTLWLTNVMLADRDVDQAVSALSDAFAARRCAVVAVSNEVGEGIVPATALGRAFRDAQGVLNQRMAAAATGVVKVVAGQPLQIKPSPEPEFEL